MSPRQSGRAVSPVVGTVLLVAIVVVLAGLAASVALGTGGPREPAPEVVLELEPTDRPVAHELTVESGDPLVGEKIELRGTSDETPVNGRLKAGETVTVYPLDSTVEVVWFGEYGTTQVLATFDPETDLPAADEGCNWVESNGPDVDINIVVRCDVITVGDADVLSSGVVIGEVDTDQPVDVDHGTVYGPVSSNNAADFDGAKVTGDVEASGDVTVTDESTIGGSLTTGSSSSVTVDGGSTVSGSVVAGDDVTLTGVTVGGDVNAPDVDITDSTIEGDVVGSTVVQLDGVTVTGHVYAPSGSFSCSDSTINGQDCGSYTPKDPGEYDG